MFTSACVWYVSRGGTVYNIIRQEYSLGGKEESSGVIPGLSLRVHKVAEEPILLPAPVLLHSVSPGSCVRVVDSCKVGFYTSTKVSLKIIYCSEEGWHHGLVDFFFISPPHPRPPSVFLSVSLSFLVLTQKNHRLEFLGGSFFRIL